MAKGRGSSGKGGGRKSTGRKTTTRKSTGKTRGHDQNAIKPIKRPRDDGTGGSTKK